MVAARGVGALSLRDLATAEGTSTTAIYSLFGNKEGLVRALFQEAFDQFHATLLAMQVTPDPMDDILALGRAYVGWARANPELYFVMFGGTLAGLSTGPEIEELVTRALGPLVGAVQRGMEAGLLRREPVQVVALSLWSTVHGLSSLSLLRLVATPEGVQAQAMLDACLRAALRAWSTDPA